MPRKPLIYSPDFPYHITARSNNKEWFRGDLHQIWKIFNEELYKLNRVYGFSPHAFVLMSNHYHLIASCTENYNLGYIMRLFQNRTAIRINSLSGRVNHCYGGRYKASIILEPTYYSNAMKYLYRNPVQGGMTDKVETWPFLVGSLIESETQEVAPVSSHIFERGLIIFEASISEWLNTSFSEKDLTLLQKAAKKGVFKFSRSNPNRPIKV